jgi:SAM-dependent methyltransferase
MDADIIERLNGINQEFYQTFAQSFSQTRGRIQSGVRSVLQKMPQRGNYLDIGCGNGNLVQAWSKMGFKGSYTGVDFSAGLITAAQENTSPISPDQSISFLNADLSSEDWVMALPALSWDAVFCYAVLHHIPSAALRLRLCRQIRSLASQDTVIWISVWQPLNSSRLKERILDWKVVGIDESVLESGDVLMDWRAHDHAALTPAYRYVHIFEENELKQLASGAGFEIAETFYSDGKEGNLGLYQRWALDN